jgi:DNA-binding transcriptional LysR family regulator
MGDPHDDGLVGRRIGAVRFHLYASRSYLERRGTPRGPDELGAHSIVDAGGVIRDVPQAVRLRELAPSARVATTLDSLKGQASAVQAGMGLAALPPYSVRGQGDLVRVLPDFFFVAVPVWLLTRAEMRRCVRVAALKSFLAQEARADRDGWRLPTPARDLDCACSLASATAPAESRA